MPKATHLVRGGKQDLNQIVFITEPTSPVPGCPWCLLPRGHSFSPWEPHLLHSEVGPRSKASTSPPAHAGAHVSRVVYVPSPTVGHGPHSKLRSALQSIFPFLKESTSTGSMVIAQSHPAGHLHRQDSNLGLCGSHPAVRPSDLLLLDCQGALWTMGVGRVLVAY